MTRSRKTSKPTTKSLADMTVEELTTMRDALIGSLNQPLLPAVAAVVGTEIARFQAELATR